MATDTQLQGAGVPLFISGKEFSARTLTDRDYTEINEYIKSEVVNIAYNTIKQQDLVQYERQELLSAAILAATQVNWFTTEGTHIMNTPKGMARLAWQMIKFYHPRTSFKSLHDLFVTADHIQENIDRVNQVFDQLNRPETEDKEDKGDSEVKDKSK